MNKLQILGKQEFMGKEIPVIEGGFGEGKRCLTDKTIAEIHNQPTREIRRRINDNIKRFKEYIDFIDLKGVGESHTLASLGYAKQSITQAEHIYLLSERGYAKLIKIMDTDLAWEIHDKLIDEYFTMRKVINSLEQQKANLLLDIYNGGQNGVLASKQLVELEVEEAKKPLIKENKKLTTEIEHKEGVIVGLVKDIDLATKRQRIKQIINHNANGRFPERYNLLYKEFQDKYHIDLQRRMDNLIVKSTFINPNDESIKITKKLKGNKMEYIDKVLCMIPELYEIACKIFENDIEELKKEWETII